MSLSKRLCLIALVLFLSLMISAVTFRKPLVVFFVKHYTSRYDLQADLNVKTLTFNRLIISDLSIENKVVVPYFELRWQTWPFHLRGLKLDITRLDVQTVGRLLGSSSQDAAGYNFADLKSYCLDIVQLEADIKAQEIIYQGVEFTSDISLLQNRAKRSVKIRLKGESRGQYPGKYSLETQLDCGKTFIDARINSASGHLKLPSGYQKNKTDIFNLEIPQAIVKISADESISAQSELTLSTTYHLKENYYGLNAKNIILEGRSNLLKTDFFSDFKLNGLSFKKDNQTWFDNLIFKGKLKKKQQHLDAMMSVSNRKKAVSLNDVLLEYDLSHQQGKLVLAKQKNSITFNQDTARVFPFIKKYVKWIRGQLAIDGEIRYEEQLKGFLNLQAQDIDVDSEYGSATGININHSINSLEKLTSPPNQFLSASTLKVGQELQGLKLKYQVKSLSLVKVSSFSVFQDAAQISAHNFEFNPINKSFKKIPLTIKDLALEKLLRLGLGDSVSAKGLLSGQLVLSYVKGKPYGEGELTANAPGWIQYRRGSTASKTLNLSDGPMDILNNYLYDFHYQTLSVDISVDEHYELVMRLKTLGRNPDYLEGKPLKLNVNLEQNLLGAIQSLVLSYDLPNKLKEYINKAGK